MAKMKKTAHPNCWQLELPHTTSGNEHDIVILENSLTVCPLHKHQKYVYICIFYIWIWIYMSGLIWHYIYYIYMIIYNIIQVLHYQYLPRRTENLHPYKYLSMNLHSSFMFNSQRMKTTQIYTKRWIDLKNQDCSYPMGFNSTTSKMNCLFIPDSTGINLKILIIMLSKRSQTKKSL